MVTTVHRNIRIGDIFTYEPTDKWCHSGIAVAIKLNGETRLRDTYWAVGSDLTNPEPPIDPATDHLLSEEEAKGAVFLGNLGDFDPIREHYAFDTQFEQHPEDKVEGEPLPNWGDYAEADVMHLSHTNSSGLPPLIRRGARISPESRNERLQEDLGEIGEAFSSSGSNARSASIELAHLMGRFPGLTFSADTVSDFMVDQIREGAKLMLAFAQKVEDAKKTTAPRAVDVP